MDALIQMQERKRYVIHSALPANRADLESAAALYAVKYFVFKIIKELQVFAKNASSVAKIKTF